MINQLQIDILIIAILTACAAAIPGVFLVLRGVALMSDAISHAILPGIVLMFFGVRDLHSPFLMVGATLAGMLTVIGTQWIIHTQSLKKDAAIGLVFPLFFSIGIILISLYVRNVHLDTDMVLLGEIAFAPFHRVIVAGVDCGPYAMWLMGALLMLNSIFVMLFYKELQVSTFDHNFAVVAGFFPGALYYGLMILTSITCVGAFDVVGAIVIVALMIVPSATALLFAQNLSSMLYGSIAVGVAASVCGYTLAWWLDASIAGSIATMCGLFFMLSLGAKKASSSSLFRSRFFLTRFSVDK